MLDPSWPSRGTPPIILDLLEEGLAEDILDEVMAMNAEELGASLRRRKGAKRSDSDEQEQDG